MNNPLRFPILLDLGLSLGEAQIYELLVENGVQKARDIVEKSGQGRGNTYNILNSLVAKKLVLEISGESQKRYQAVDPSHLRELLARKEEEVARLGASLSQSLSTMGSLFNLSTGKPAIEYFEGEKGVEEATFDTLNASGEILTILDADASEKYTHEFNARYIPARLRKKIPKRIVAFNAAKTRSLMQKEINELTDYRFVEAPTASLDTMIQIYNDSVGLLTMGEKPIGIIVRDQKIAQTLRVTFEALWGSLPNQKAVSETT